MHNKMKPKLKPFGDYILIRPDIPKGGKFSVGDTYIEEQGIIEDVGEGVSPELKKLKGKHVLFNAWACDQKTLGGEKYYFATESANAVCGII